MLSTILAITPSCNTCDEFYINPKQFEKPCKICKWISWVHSIMCAYNVIPMYIYACFLHPSKHRCKHAHMHASQYIYMYGMYAIIYWVLYEFGCKSFRSWMHVHMGKCISLCVCMCICGSLSFYTWMHAHMYICMSSWATVYGVYASLLWSTHIYMPMMYACIHMYMWNSTL